MFGKRFSAQRLRKALLKLLQEPNREYTFQSLYLKVHPQSAELLARVLDQLAQQGEVRRVFRVESPITRIGIGDYSTIDEIPSVLYDRTADQEINIEPTNIRPIFKAG